jgi:hypothetical protein
MSTPRFNVGTLMLVVYYSALAFGLAAYIRNIPRGYIATTTTTVTETPIGPAKGRPLPAGR